MSKLTRIPLWSARDMRGLSAEVVALAGPESPDARRNCVGLGCINDEQLEYVISDLPLCQQHFMSWLVDVGRKKAEMDARIAALDEARQEPQVVYYIRFADHIKIGRSTHLSRRMSAMHVHPSALLAVEPAEKRTELQRHTMFADERVARTELFDPSPRLLDHIDHVRSLFGDPKDFL